MEGVYTALQHYSNVHRGSGHHSKVSTYLFEKARDVVLEYLGLGKASYRVIFTNPSGLGELRDLLQEGSYRHISSSTTALPLAVEALAVKKGAFPKGPPPRTGGGNARLTAREWVIWARPPGRFEAGTPAIINIITFARALRLMKKYGDDVFLNMKKKQTDPAELIFRNDLEGKTGEELLQVLRESMIGRHTPVPTLNGTKPYLHFDHAASTMAFSPVWEAWREALQLNEEYQARMIEEVRGFCASFLKAPEDKYDISFTSGTTESINLVAKLLESTPHEDGHPVVLSSVMEHSSNDLPWRLIKGHEVERVTMDKEGFLDLDEIRNCLIAYNSENKFGNKRIRLVAVTAASNLLATYNDLKALSHIVHEHGALLLVDAAQLVAHRPLDIEGTGIDFLAFSAHKVYAPFGTGVLISRKGWLNQDKPFVSRALESGMANPGGIAALGKALVLLDRISYDVIIKEEDALTIKLLQGLKSIPKMRLQGLQDEGSVRMADKGGLFVFDIGGRLPGKISRQLAERAGIGVRFGCHCAHMMVKHMVNIKGTGEKLQGYMVRMFPKLNLPGMLRISMGLANTEEELEELLRVLDRIAKKLPEEGAGMGKGEIKARIEAHILEVSEKVF